MHFCISANENDGMRRVDSTAKREKMGGKQGGELLRLVIELQCLDFSLLLDYHSTALLCQCSCKCR